MQREIILTNDGSHTVTVPELNVSYHSMHGAIQESMHVFIEAGFRQLSGHNTIRIFEMGFGTGLNALLTLVEEEKTKQPVHYTSIELFPLTSHEIDLLNYCSQLNREDLEPLFKQIHSCEWEKEIRLTDHFTLQKINASLSHEKSLSSSSIQSVHLIYYDAFAPSVQPELWTPVIFERLYSLLTPGGILVTYCSKSDVRRAMQAAGFSIEKIPGPPGKREMVRAGRK